MIELDAFKQQLSAAAQPLREVSASLDLEGKQNRIAELERNMEAPGFWDDPDKATRIMQELKNLKATVDQVKALQSASDDIEVLIDMAYEEEDDSLIPEIEEE